jgi:hypothetical protein
LGCKNNTFKGFDANDFWEKYGGADDRFADDTSWNLLPFLLPLNIRTEEISTVVFAWFVGADIAWTFVHIVTGAIRFVFSEEERGFENNWTIVRMEIVHSNVA